MDMPGRTYSIGNGYRYSINGQEKTPEIAPNTTTAEFWQYDARIVRRWNIDPKPNISISPYNCFAGNPIFLADVRGDTVDVSHLRANNSKANDALISDLQNKTGLTISVNEKTGIASYLKENGAAKLARDGNGNIVGSKAARKELIKMLDSKTMITVKDDPTGPTRVEQGQDKKGRFTYTNTILINSVEIESSINETSKDLHSTTYGYALTFFHERGHTLYGGGHDDSNEPWLNAGDNEILPNRIRKQLSINGTNYGQRLVYTQLGVNGVDYLPFTQEAWDSLKRNEVPSGGYIIIIPLGELLKKK